MGSRKPPHALAMNDITANSEIVEHVSKVIAIVAIFRKAIDHQCRVGDINLSLLNNSIFHKCGNVSSNCVLGNYEYRASMIIFPQATETAVAYVLGYWRQIINPYAIDVDWGLRLAASTTICEENDIKQIQGNTFHFNPTIRSERKQRLASIDTFPLEVGTEVLCSLRLLPAYPPGTCKRLATGTDSYKFHVEKATKTDLKKAKTQGLEAKTKEQGNTINTLHKIATALLAVNTDEIHPKLRSYIDEKEEDPETLNKLNCRLTEILSSNNASKLVFPASVIWQYYGKTSWFSFGENNDKKNLFVALEGQRPNSDSVILISSKEFKDKAPLKQIIYSLPIESELDSGNFFRLYRGHWFKVLPSRFSAIIKKMRSPHIKIAMSALLPYTVDDATYGDAKSYQELRYNQRVINSLSGKTKGILLDRLCVYFGTNHNQFEFGDMLIYDEKQCYIIHVKRKQSDDFDHHRSQVERCAQYLATELNKKTLKNCF